MLKEHLLTLFLVGSTALTILVFAHLNQLETLPVFDTNDLLFEHQVTRGSFVLTSDPYRTLTLAFLNRDIAGFSYVGSTYTIRTDEISHLFLESNENIPFTTHVIVSRNPDLQEVLVMESGTSIAHHARAKKTACDETAVFVISSSDLSNEDFLVIGLNSAGEIIWEVDTP